MATITIKPTDNWQQILQEHDGVGVVYVDPGYYKTTKDIIFKAPRIDIRCNVLGSATFEARWAPVNTITKISGVDLLPDGSRGLFAVTGGGFSLTDCQCFLPAGWPEMDGLGYFSGSWIHFSARQRDVIFSVKDRVKAQVFDIDCSTYKWLGNTATARVKIEFTNKIAGIILDASRGLFAGTQVRGGGSTIGGGIIFRRLSTGILANDLQVHDLRHAIRAMQGSRIFVYDGLIRNCMYGLSNEDGQIKYDAAKVIFDQVANKTVKPASNITEV